VAKRPIPTLDDFLKYTGAHTPALWQSVGDTWVCPACRRTKFEQLRWTTRNPRSLDRFKDWIAPLHTHHDHAAGHFGPGRPRFPATVMCDQCNAADGQAKKRLGLPPNFSFSPEEIGRFIVATPHQPHVVDLVLAAAIYAQLCEQEAAVAAARAKDALPFFWSR
jgi:hypothetical protein